MGGLVTTSNTNDPAATLGDVPPATVVFEGFEVNDDLTEVTAYASELNSLLGGSFAGSWKVMAVATCGYEYAFEGLQLREANHPLGTQKYPESSKWWISCTGDRQNIDAGARVRDFETGNWYLDRFSRENAFQGTIFSEAYYNPESGIHASHRHIVQTICVDE